MSSTRSPAPSSKRRGLQASTLPGRRPTAVRLPASKLVLPAIATARASALVKDRQCVVCKRNGTHSIEVSIGPVLAYLCQSCGDDAFKLTESVGFLVSFFRKRLR